MQEFSSQTRAKVLERFQNETFDLLIIGGGITGAATARDAASRGLNVALVEARDFAWGTSSRSSKLIHGGLRYLENFELKLVFEALSERTKLLKLVPHMVRPLKFYLPVYQGDKQGKRLLSIGLWLYDFLSLFRTPGFHKELSRKRFLEKIPFLKEEGLKGGFQYYDASMWDDALSVETLRSAASMGASIANYVEALAPLWEDNQIVGFEVHDKESGEKKFLKAKRTVVCAGPWTDQVGLKLSPHWHHWLNPSKGVHLIFDLKRIPVPGAMVMSHPEDGRIAFVIPRLDYGAGVVIVGTTDGPTPADPEKATIDSADVHYLMDLLQKYFPKLQLTTADILSAYVGVRPLMGSQASTAGSEGQGLSTNAASLQKVSREHYIGRGPGGVILVAGGKYTTHRTMALEIVDVALEAWKKDFRNGISPALPKKIGSSKTDVPVNAEATEKGFQIARSEADRRGIKVPEALWTRYGGEALEIFGLAAQEVSRGQPQVPDSPEGFPWIQAQLRYALRTSMVLHLEDFYIRRSSLYASRKDHGLPWAESLSRVWAEELGKSEEERQVELERLKNEIEQRSAWQKTLTV